MSIINKLSNIVKGQTTHTSDEWNIPTPSNDMNNKMEYSSIPIPEFKIIDISDNVYLLNRSGRVCVGMLPDEGYEKQKSYCSRMGARGHESPFEHTNVISIITVPSYAMFTNTYVNYLTEFLSYTTYCRVSVKKQHDMSISILISASSRALGHIIRQCSEENPFVQTIKNLMCTSFEKEILSQYIDEGLIEEDDCISKPEANIKELCAAVTQYRYDYEKLESPENYDTVADDYENTIEERRHDILDFLHRKDHYLDKIYQNIQQYGFDIKDVFKVATISFVFHDISRACANQMTRHRVAISQESQRYVTHQTDKSQFINPLDTYPERYKDLDVNAAKRLRDIDPFDTYKFALENKVVKEDARAWLPMNVTTKVMMTFTIEQLAHFIDIRSHKAAQKEVQLVTETLIKCLIDELEYNFNINDSEEDEFPDILSRILFISLTPNNKDIANRYNADRIFFAETTRPEDNGIDEDLGEETEITELEIKDIKDAEAVLKKAEEYKELEKEEENKDA